MLCSDCPKRSKCVRVCAELKAELAKVSGYLREELLSPEMIKNLADQSPEVYPKEPMELGADLLDLGSLVDKLAEVERAVIIGYFWEGKSLKVLAREFNFSRAELIGIMEQAFRHLRVAIRDKLKNKRQIPIRVKLGYNKRVK